MIPIEYYEKYPNRDYSLQREELRECTESAIFEMNIEYDSPEFWSLYIRQISPENACKLIDLAKMNSYVKFEFLKLLRKSPKYKNAILELIDSILSENFYDYEIIFCVYDILEEMNLWGEAKVENEILRGLRGSEFIENDLLFNLFTTLKLILQNEKIPENDSNFFRKHFHLIEDLVPKNSPVRDLLIVNGKRPPPRAVTKAPPGTDRKDRPMFQREHRTNLQGYTPGEFLEQYVKKNRI